MVCPSLDKQPEILRDDPLLTDNEPADDPEHILWVTGDTRTLRSTGSVLSCSPSSPTTQPSPLYSYHVNAPYRASTNSYFLPLCQARRKAILVERKERRKQRKRQQIRKRVRETASLFYIYSNRLILVVLAAVNVALFAV